MLSAEANERLTRVGAGTPMGELLRRYWIPIRPASQVMEENVLAVRVLGENLVLFRTLTGEFGLVGERCPHRMTQLKYGYPGDAGLRCCYHGWMFGPSGQCLDMPLESSSTLKDHIRITAYPVKEMGGLVWAYLGPEPAPLLPPWDLFVVPDCIRQIGVMELPCNWLQAQENAGDPTHSAILHGHYFRYLLNKKTNPKQLAEGQTQEALKARTELAIGVERLWAKATPYGMTKGIVYSQTLGAPRDYVSEHSTVIFPFFTQTGRPNQVRQEIQIRVPIDDTHMYHINYACFLALNGVQVPKQDCIPWFTVPLYDDEGQPVLNNILSQDAHAWIAQGPITDRTGENLGRTDVPVTFLRKQFEEQLQIMEKGSDPMNVFRDPDAMPTLLHGGQWEVSAAAQSTSSSGGTGAYDRGYNFYEDANRFGPALPQIIEMIRKINDSQTPLSS